MRALDGIDLSLGRGDSLGLLGESGSGKSSLAHALLGLAGEAALEGEIVLDGLDLRGLDEDAWRAVRWRRIALGFQSPAALNPVLRIVDQVAEPLRLHLDLGRAEARRRASALLVEVGLEEGETDRYPRELSGGQRRLALLAIAVCCEPEVLVLDEPTAGLDAATRARVLEYLARLRERGTALLVLGHDVEALSGLAERTGVLYRGWLAELGPTARVLGDPRHPYSRGLLDARPTLATVKELRSIRGRPPDPTASARGCPFVERCTQALAECAETRPGMQPPTGEEDGRTVACLRGGLVTLLSASALSKAYSTGNGVVRRRRVQALEAASLDVRHGEVVGVVGSTGAGKTTLGLLLVGLLAPDAGSVAFQGRDLGDPEVLADARRRIQLVFQDPFEALSPRLTVAESVREPLEVQRLAAGAEADEIVRRVLDELRLPTGDSFLGRHTHELSGGQLQRVALARALVLDPQLVVLDEPVAMLDPSEQAAVLQLLKAIQVERGMAMVLVSHDLAAVLRMADRVVVLDRGRVVEEQTGTALLVSPRHPATQSLLAAAGREAVFGRPTQEVPR